MTFEYHDCDSHEILMDKDHIEILVKDLSIELSCHMAQTSRTEYNKRRI